MKDIIVNAVPCTTWNWLKMNKDTVSLEATFEEIKFNLQKLPDGVSLSSEKPESLQIPQIFSGICNEPNPKAIDNRRKDGSFVEKSVKMSISDSTTSNHPVQKLISSTASKPQYLTISGKQEKPIVINYNFSKNSIANHTIIAEENSESTIIFMYTGNSEISLLQTKILVQPNAKIHIIKVQLMDKTATLLDDTGFYCQDNAFAKFSQIELGGKHNNSGLNVTLYGYQSVFKSNVAYLCKENQYLDMNHIVNHFGKKSECNMQVNGTLKDEAIKTYRGTIDFKNGCSGSKGNEMEESLVLSPKVINKSLPNILCDEEDVEGEHGATIGRLSSEILFYMESRGISAAEAETLISKAKIQAVADKIPDEDIQNKIMSFIEE